MWNTNICYLEGQVVVKHKFLSSCITKILEILKSKFKNFENLKFFLVQIVNLSRALAWLGHFEACIWNTNIYYLEGQVVVKHKFLSSCITKILEILKSKF